ncbi:MAG: restriction endonuclease subunit S, partial [Marinicellaceae bacterium]
SSQLRTLRLNTPSLPEQQKIASFLSAVDEKIQPLSRKKALLEAYKKGVRQQIFPSTGSGQRSQQIRFKDENGNDYRDWEEKKLNDVVEIMTDYVASGSFESLRNNVTVYDELEYALYVRLTDLRHNLKHNKLKYVDKFSYEFLSKSNLYGGELLIANIGANVGDVYMMPYDFGRATIAPNMIMIRENMKYYSSKYLFYCLNSYEGRKAVNRAISGSGQPKLSKTDFKNVKVLLPSVQEQKRIESLLTGVDIRIESVEKEISQTEAFKKGLLQKMFV